MTNEQREAILKVLDGLTALELDGSINAPDHRSILYTLDEALLDNKGFSTSDA